MKYLHIVTVVVGIVLPFVPVITAFGTGGFTISRFPPVLCVPNNTDATFYSLLLPSLIIVAVGITLLIVLFWKIHKVCSLIAPLGPRLALRFSSAGAIKTEGRLGTRLLPSVVTPYILY